VTLPGALLGFSSTDRLCPDPRQRGFGKGLTPAWESSSGRATIYFSDALSRS